MVGRAVAGLDQSLINGRMEKRLTTMMAAVIEPKFLGKTAEQARRTRGVIGAGAVEETSKVEEEQGPGETDTEAEA